jgi:putative molybdopterin biosynthesis protein
MHATASETGKRVSLERARELVVANVAVTGFERVPAEEAFGRITAECVLARLASPYHRVAAMDGIAVRAADTLAAADGKTVLLAVHDTAEPPLPGDTCCRVVDTGSALPQWADAVVRIEDTLATPSGYEVRACVAPGRDVRAAGEDFAAGALLLGPGRLVRAADVGAMLATGVCEVCVRRRPRVRVLATGGEVIEPLRDDEVPLPGQVIEFNSRVLAGSATEWGSTVEYCGRVQDTEEELARRIREESRLAEVLCVIAGSSAGRKDVTISALAACGEILFRGVDVAPGRPTACARVGETLVLAVPGYPVSAIVAYRELLRPALDAALARAHASPRRVLARVARDTASRLGVEEILRVCLTASRRGELVAATLPRGAGAIGSVTQAHGLLRIGPTCEGIAAGSTVEIELLESDFDARDAIVVASGPDAMAAALEQAAAARTPPLRFSYLGRPPRDAIAALGSAEAHLAILGGAEPLPRIDVRPVVYRILASDGSTAGTIVLSEDFAACTHGASVRSTLERADFAGALGHVLGRAVAIAPD